MTPGIMLAAGKRYRRELAAEAAGAAAAQEQLPSGAMLSHMPMHDHLGIQSAVPT